MTQPERSRDEQSPLLSRRTAVVADASSTVVAPPLQDATVARALRVAIPGILIIVAFEFAMDFITIAFSQLMEGAICVKTYSDVQDPYSDPRCKNDDVQTMLSFVRAWETSLAILPGFFTALPYGMVADKYGPKFVLLLVFLGNVISLGMETVVCECRLSRNAEPNSIKAILRI